MAKTKTPKVEAVVKWFDDAKGYGFILFEGKDYFVHYKAIKMKGHRTLVKDQRVSFTPTKNGERHVAVDVEILP